MHTENNIIEKSSKDERHLMFMEWKTIVKIATLGKLIYRLNIIPIKIPTFLRVDPTNHEMERTIIAKTVLTIYFPDLKTYYKITVIKTMWYWQKRCMHQCNIIDSQEINHYTYVQFSKGATNTFFFSPKKITFIIVSTSIHI